MSEIAHFSFEDVLKLFKLNINSTLDDFKERAAVVLSQSNDETKDLLTKAIQKGLEFFSLNQEGFSQKKHEETDNEETDNEETDNEETDNEGTEEAQYDNKAFMLESRGPAETTATVKHAKGTLNPNARQTITQLVSIDSTYTKNVPGYNVDPVIFYKDPINYSTNLEIELFEPLKEVLSIKLHTIQISGSWFSFDHCYGNTVFWYCEDISNPQWNELYINIGSYLNVDNLIDDMAYQINKSPETTTKYSTPLDPTAPTSPKLFKKKHIDANSSTHHGPSTPDEPHQNSIESNSFKLEYNGHDNTGILFYSTEIKPRREYVGKIYANHNLGWYLGYRHIHENTNLIEVKVTKGEYSHSPPEIHGSGHFFLSFDDFNKNQSCKGLVSNDSSKLNISIPNKHRSLQSKEELYVKNETYDYSTKLSMRRIIPNTSLITAKEIYSVNEILKYNQQQSLDVYLTHKNLPDILAIIPLPSLSRNSTLPHVLTGNNIQSNERTYFGPVDIKKLRVKLYDDKGNLVNLHGNNWSFTLIIEKLYQYLG